MKHFIIITLLFAFLSGCIRQSISFNDDPSPTCREDLLLFYSSRSGNGDIYLLSPETKELNIFVNNDSTDGAPRYNAFDNELIFRSNKEGTPYLYSKSLTTGIESWKMVNPAGDEVPDWAPDRSAIVFSKALENGLFDLVVRDLSENTEKTLVSGATSDFYPSWSPDGSRILFEYSDSTSASDIALINTDGSGFQKIATDKFYGHPAWAPNGLSVLFYIYQNGQADIYSVKTDGTELTQLTNTPTNELIARYSPDGSKIIVGGIANDDWEILIMNADGSNLEQLTTNPGFDGDPVWVRCR